MMKTKRTKKTTQFFIFSIIILIIIFLSLFSINQILLIIKKQNQIDKHIDDVEKLTDNITYKTFEYFQNSTSTISQIKLIQNTLKNNIYNDSNTFHLLNSIKKMLSADIIYLMDMKGLVIVSTHSDDNVSLLGNNYYFRPYFKQAISGKKTVYPAIGVTTGQRGLYFSSPVEDNDKIIGVVVVKYRLKQIDLLLKDKNNINILVSPEGVIFASNKLDWMYKTISPLELEVLRNLKESRQFAESKLNSLYLKLKQDQTVIIDQHKYIYAKDILEPIKWEIISFTRYNPDFPLTERQKRLIIMILSIIFILIFIIIIILTLNSYRRQSENKYGMVVENSNEGILILHNDFSITFINKRFLKITGYTKSELNSVSFLHLIEKSEQKNVLDLFDNLNSNKYDPPYEVRLISKRNDIKWMLMNIVSIEWNNRPAYLIFMTDITERKSYQNQLIKSEQNHKYLIDSLIEGVITLDENKKVTFVNKSFCHLVNMEFQDILNKDISSILQDHNILDFIDHHSDKTANRYEWTITDNNNKEIKCLITLSKMYDQIKNYLGSILVVTDMTEIRKLEERLISSEKMEFLGQMAGGVAHDLNNILSGIVSVPDLILTDINLKNNKIRENIELIKKSGLMAKALVNDLLTLSRRNIIKKEPIDLNKVINDLFQSAIIINYKKNFPDMIFNINLQKKLPKIIGSDLYLTIAITNLIINSIEAIDYNGEITLTTNADDKNVILKIKDNGHGLNKTDQKKIFEPFYTKKKLGHSGTGLGLAIVWGVIKDIDGTIQVKSELNIGTEFIINVPLFNVDKTHNELNDLKKDDNETIFYGKNEVIVVVDDLEMQCEIAKKMLKKLRYQSHVFSKGTDFLSYLENEKDNIDVVLLDMILENDQFDGLDIFKKIIEVNPDQKVIFVTGYAEMKKLNEILQYGNVQILKKPYSIEKFSKYIYQAIHNKHNY